MKRAIIKLVAYIKGMLLVMKPHLFLGILKRPLLMVSNTLSLSEWISQHNDPKVLNDFYTPSRNYVKRYELYQYVINTLGLENAPIDYLEFGVSEAHSFKWWVAHLHHLDTRFYGFDTFEGLPENWGTFYSKGDMSANIPQIDDARVQFEKGFFQTTLPPFLLKHDLRNGKRKIIHLDADLFSSTLYALTSLAPYLNKGDILMFDEFNVPNHEYFAFKMFSDSYYIKTKLVGAVNNYYQVALIIE